MSEKTSFTGNRGLELREDLIFEIGARNRSGVEGVMPGLNSLRRTRYYDAAASRRAAGGCDASVAYSSAEGRGSHDDG